MTTVPTITKAISDEMVEVLLEGLAEFRRRVKDGSLQSLKSGDNLRTLRIHLTERELVLRNTVRSILGMHVGKEIPQALVLRVALNRLVADAQRSLSDPALAAELRQQVLELRAKRVPE